MKKAIYVSIIVIIIVAIMFTALMLILKYNEKGETNMPFKISKISIISSTGAEHNEDKQNLWNKSVEQNNDIYIYIEKNSGYKKQALIKTVKISSIEFLKDTPKKGIVFKYRPSTSEKELFQNVEEYKTEELIFEGDQKTDIKNLKISNQGGIIAYRISNQDLGNYISNENEINYNELLKKINISYDDLKTKVKFNLNIQLENGKEFATQISLDLPIEGIVENGKGSKEITDLEFVFKRVEN